MSRLPRKNEDVSKQSEGGRARAAKLTREQRRAIAQQAAKARWERASDPTEMPVVTLPGTLPIGAVNIDVYRLRDGRRLISKRAMAKALTLKSEGGNAFLRTVTRQGVRSAIDANLWEKIENPIVFRLLDTDLATGVGPTADGYEAETLIDVCHSIVKARIDDQLDKSQYFLAIQAEIIIRATAKVGINKLVDDAVGYVSDRAKSEYIEMFKDFIAKECQQWHHEFPEKLPEMLYKLYGMKRIDPASSRHPRFFSKFIRKYIYHPLANSRGVILEMLDEKNPVIYASGGRRYKLFQFLEKDVGLPALRQQIWQVIGIGNSSRDRRAFDRAFYRAFPEAVPLGYQWPLGYDDHR